MEQRRIESEHRKTMAEERQRQREHDKNDDETDKNVVFSALDKKDLEPAMPVVQFW